jgi:hypothetical protein
MPSNNISPKKKNMHSSPVPRPQQSKYPTPDAYKRDAYYGSSYADGVSGAEHYLRGRPHYVKHVRAMQRGSQQQVHAVRSLYRGQFLCGGWEQNYGQVLPLATAPVKCPSSYPMKPVCKCTSMPSYC